MEHQLFTKTTTKGRAYTWARTRRHATWLRQQGFTMNASDATTPLEFPLYSDTAVIQLIDCDGDFLFGPCYSMTDLEDTLDHNQYYGIYAHIYWVRPSHDYATVISFIRMNDAGDFLYDPDFITAHLIDSPTNNHWPLSSGAQPHGIRPKTR